MSFRDIIAVGMCRHARFADDGPDAFGERLCAECEQRVVVVLTEAAFKTFANMVAKQGHPGASVPFPEID